jgi:hypothetical protein
MFALAALEFERATHGFPPSGWIGRPIRYLTFDWKTKIAKGRISVE